VLSMGRPRKNPLVLPDNWRSMNALPLPLWALAHGVSEAVAKAAVRKGKLRARRLSDRKIITRGAVSGDGEPRGEPNRQRATAHGRPVYPIPTHFPGSTPTVAGVMTKDSR
jgi:hypothetical protein